MSRDFNTIHIEGRLVERAETKTHNGSEFVKFRLASTERDTDPEKKTIYIDCEWWDPNNAVKYLEKGKGVLISGRLSYSEGVDKNDGTKRSKHFIKVQNLELRGGGGKKQEETTNSDGSSESLGAEEFIGSVNEN